MRKPHWSHWLFESLGGGGLKSGAQISVQIVAHRYLSNKFFYAALQDDDYDDDGKDDDDDDDGRDDYDDKDDDDDENNDDDNGVQNKSQRTKPQRTKSQMMRWDFVRLIIITNCPKSPKVCHHTVQ